MATISMSAKERRRLELFGRVRDGELTLVRASELLGLSYRQTRRCWRRFREEGDGGLVHRSRGRPSNRRGDPERRERVLARYRERYSDFGPTLAAEYLVREEGIVVAVETLRQWLIGAGLWSRRRRSPSPHRAWRARRACRGELVQLDGSHHDWFEGRRGKCVLMVLVDDATGALYARFSEGETTAACLETFGRYVERNGLPRAVYADRHSIHHTTRDATVEESLADEAPATQFGMALAELDVALILAHSPQAKGRVERANGTLQDRLVKALRLAGIDTLEEANAFLEETFLPDFNERFGVEPSSRTDLHRRVPRRVELWRVLSFREERVVRNDGTLQWRNRWLQLVGGWRPRPGRRVTVREQLDGRLRVFAGGREVGFEELPERPPRRARRAPPRPRRRGSSKPSADHPWRKPYACEGTER
jgi:transposase